MWPRPRAAAVTDAAAVINITNVINDADDVIGTADAIDAVGAADVTNVTHGGHPSVAPIDVTHGCPNATVVTL